jgi:hypothetical protein
LTSEDCKLLLSSISELDKLHRNSTISDIVTEEERLLRASALRAQLLELDSKWRTITVGSPHIPKWLDPKLQRRMRNLVLQAVNCKSRAIPFETMSVREFPLDLPSFIDLGAATTASLSEEKKTTADAAAEDNSDAVFSDRRSSVLEFYLTPFSWYELKWCQPTYEGLKDRFGRPVLMSKKWMLCLSLVTIDLGAELQLHDEGSMFAVKLDYDAKTQVTRSVVRYVCPNPGQEAFDFWSFSDLEACSEVQADYDAQVREREERERRRQAAIKECRARSLSFTQKKMLKSLEEGELPTEQMKAAAALTASYMPVNLTVQQQAHIDNTSTSEFREALHLGYSKYSSLEEVFDTVSLLAPCALLEFVRHV